MLLTSGVNNRRLREELGEIVDRYVSDRVGEQIGQIANLAPKYPHSISLVQEAIPNRPETFQFNCYQHSFGLVNVESVNQVMVKNPTVFPGRDFVQFLVETRLREVPIEDIEDGDHILYATDSQFQHAGRVGAGAIESKWGLMHLWRHGLYEVPWSYGSTISFFRRVSPEDSVRAFFDYAIERGVIFS